jgi:hypothetical protein
VVELNKEYTKRLQKTMDLDAQIKAARKFLKDLENQHADALQEVIKLDIYKRFASHQNNNDKLFKWTYSESLDTWISNNKRCDRLYHDYQGISNSFKITIVHRKDLKVWKYEVHISGQKRSFDDFRYVEMYQRSNRNGTSMWSMNDEYLSTVGPKETKFKTMDEAADYVMKTKLKFMQVFSKEIRQDKDLYKQACSKYDNIIRIELDWQTRKAFYDLLPYYPGIEILSGDLDKLELTGDGVKETIADLKEKYKMNIKVLAG